MVGSKQTKLRLPAAPRHLVQRNETDLVELNAVRSNIPLYIICVVSLPVVFVEQIPNGCCNRLCEFRTCDWIARFFPIQGSNRLGPRSVSRPMNTQSKRLIPHINSLCAIPNTNKVVRFIQNINDWYPSLIRVFQIEGDGNLVRCIELRLCLG